MPRYVAFLRAINVGGHVVKMDRLRSLFEAMKLANVETFIASGNVIFDSPSSSGSALEKRIERSLESALGYPVATFVRSTREVADVAAHEPFKPPKGSKADADGTLYIGFTARAPSAAARTKLMAHANAVDQFHVKGREVYWLCRKKFSETKFSGAVLEKAIGMQATLRNVTTVTKIAAKYPPRER
jgi:uncharacterized protein (DUF1697 family)